jgi:hypothetical protein
MRGVGLPALLLAALPLVATSWCPCPWSTPKVLMHMLHVAGRAGVAQVGAAAGDSAGGRRDARPLASRGARSAAARLPGALCFRAPACAVPRLCAATCRDSCPSLLCCCALCFQGGT